MKYVNIHLYYFLFDTDFYFIFSIVGIWNIICYILIKHKTKYIFSIFELVFYINYRVTSHFILCINYKVK